MSQNFELHAEVRTDVGKGASRRLRRETNRIPAIIYGAGEDPQNLTLAQNQVVKALQSESFYSSILTINVDGNKQKAVIKSIQRHPSKPFVLHMDFFRVSAKEKITMQVPLHFIGDEDAPGVKEGGIVSHQMTEVEVSCLPGDLPEYIEVDISALELDHPLHLSDIKVPSGVELSVLAKGEDHDLPIVSIHIPRAVVEEEEGEEEGEEGAEGETPAEGEEAKADDKGGNESKE